MHACLAQDSTLCYREDVCLVSPSKFWPMLLVVIARSSPHIHTEIYSGVSRRLM
jgi:hypothetical protein